MRKRSTIVRGGPCTVSRALVGAVALLCCAAATSLAEVAGSAHDFTLDAPSSLRLEASTTARPGSCFYCHAPHSEYPAAALWAGASAGRTYQLYESATLKAVVGQPTGASRICLSCHDGTLASGDLADAIERSGSFDGGRLSAGIDLSGDHPISFVYDSELAGRAGHLRDPATLPSEVRLDRHDRLQCTSCHDPHADPYGDFLVVDNRGSRLCMACHRMPGWRNSAHATSPATEASGEDPWPHTRHRGVADNGCANCHRQHGAPHREWLLLRSDQSELCLTCHDGDVARADVRAAFRSLSAHPVELSRGIHSPDEDPRFMDEHVACSDCHEPHSVRPHGRAQLGEMAAFGDAPGVSHSGAYVRVAQNESEVCYKCHGLVDDRFPLVTRADNFTNTRLELATTNPSYHPVDGVGRNSAIQGLEPGLTASSIITCSDCHSSDQSRNGGARGPHGSLYEPILSDEYQVSDPATESYGSYALCYRCHTRDVLLADLDGFPHRLHVVDERTPCAVCHDAHGSRTGPALINFMVLGVAGQVTVSPSSSGLLEFESGGRGQGRCYLLCHGADHDPAEYGGAGSTGRIGLP